MGERPPWLDTPTLALLLIGILVVTGAVITLVIITRCVIWFIPECMELTVRQWLADMIVILLALVMRHPPSGGNGGSEP